MPLSDADSAQREANERAQNRDAAIRDAARIKARATNRQTAAIEKQNELLASFAARLERLENRAEQSGEGETDG